MSNSTLDLPKTKTQLNNDLQMTSLLMKSLQSLLKTEKELTSSQNALEVTFDKVRQLEEDSVLERQFDAMTTAQKRLNRIQSQYTSGVASKLETSLASLSAEVKLVQQKSSDYEKRLQAKEKKEGELGKIINDAKANQ